MDSALQNAMLEAASDDDDMRYQVLAFASGGGGRFKKPFMKFKRKPGGKSDKRPTTPPRHAADASKKPSCINCGNPGHRTADWPEGRSDISATMFYLRVTWPLGQGLHKDSGKHGRPAEIAVATDFYWPGQRPRRQTTDTDDKDDGQHHAPSRSSSSRPEFL